jgi:hypothetical protein
MLLAFAMSKYQLVAIRIRYNRHAYLIAQHNGFGLNPRFLELLDAVFVGASVNPAFYKGEIKNEARDFLARDNATRLRDLSL